MQPSYVVIERWHEGKMLRYAYPGGADRAVAEERLAPADAVVARISGFADRQHGCLPANLAGKGADAEKFRRHGGRSRRRRNDQYRADALTTEELVAQAERDNGSRHVDESNRQACADCRLSPPWPGPRSGCITAALEAAPAGKVSCHFQAEMDGGGPAR